MYLPDWEKEIITGDPKIDEEHQELFKRIDAFMMAVNKNIDPKQITETLLYLREYITVHFEEEELFHQKSKAPGFEDHFMAHRELTQELGNIFDAYQSEGVTAHLQLRIINSLVKKLMEQIHNHDLPLARYVMEKPMKIKDD